MVTSWQRKHSPSRHTVSSSSERMRSFWGVTMRKTSWGSLAWSPAE